MCEFHWFSTVNVQPLQGKILKDYHLKGFISDAVDLSFHSILKRFVITDIMKNKS